MAAASSMVEHSGNTAEKLGYWDEMSDPGLLDYKLERSCLRMSGRDSRSRCDGADGYEHA